MTFKSIVIYMSLAAWLVAGLVWAPLAPSAQAQVGRAANRAAKQALKRGAAGKRGARQGIVRQAPRTRIPRAAANPGRRNTGSGMIERLMRMPAPQRRRFLRNNRRFQRLPQPQRQRIQQRLREFDRMPARQRELLLERYELFGQLSPQQQQQARGLYQRWGQVPPGRRKELMTEFQQLRQATPNARQERLVAPEFEQRYSKSEQRLLKDITGLLPPKPHFSPPDGRASSNPSRNGQR